MIEQAYYTSGFGKLQEEKANGRDRTRTCDLLRVKEME